MNLANLIKKNLVAATALSCLLSSLFIASASAASTTTGSNTASSQASLLSLIQTKGANEIERRLTTLNGLDSLISGSTKISTSDKTTLTDEVNAEISSLTSLKSSLAACTSLSCAEPAAQSIFSEYRVYALVVPQVQMIKTADNQQLVQGKLSQIAGQLETRVSGKSTLEADLTTLNSNISAAQKLSSSVETSVEALTPASYNNNHQLLAQYYDDLKTAQSDNQTAYNQAKTIISSLTSSGSKTTPTN